MGAALTAGSTIWGSPTGWASFSTSGALGAGALAGCPSTKVTVTVSEGVLSIRQRNSALLPRPETMPEWTVRVLPVSP